MSFLEKKKRQHKLDQCNGEKEKTQIEFIKNKNIIKTLIVKWCANYELDMVAAWYYLIDQL